MGLIYEKNQRPKISSYCPFKSAVCSTLCQPIISIIFYYFELGTAASHLSYFSVLFLNLVLFWLVPIAPTPPPPSIPYPIAHVYI
jgi:hypothetical protein